LLGNSEGVQHFSVSRRGTPVLNVDEPLDPRLDDVSGFGRYVLRRLLGLARSDQPVGFAKLLRDHLGPEVRSHPVVTGNWPGYDRVNVQLGLDHWLDQQSRSYELVGMVGFEHRQFQLGDLVQMSPPFVPQPGSVTLDVVASGPDGQTVNCVRCAIWLVRDSDAPPMAILLRPPEEHGHRGGGDVTVQIMCPDGDRASSALAELRQAILDHNVFRGQVLSFSGEMFDGQSGLISIQRRPHLGRDELVLQPGTLEAVERQVVGIAAHRERLRKARQHLKRGILLHGPPGTGKTHTVRYLLGQLEGVTAVVLSGDALGMLSAACSIARVLQPSVIVIEDVDLIASDRESYGGWRPMLFELLNQMDGLGEDVDVAFLLTTNRPDLLESALAARPGRVDEAIEIPLPDAVARRRLIQLYRGGLQLEVDDVDTVITRTEGVTASFVKELLRRSALEAIDDTVTGPDDAIVVTDRHVSAALDHLLDDRNRLTRVLLGGERPPADSDRTVELDVDGADGESD
jgi:hypothetical protein